ncbi:MAG: AraC family transcriptional regulator [Cetobacterium sp.]
MMKTDFSFIKNIKNLSDEEEKIIKNSDKLDYSIFKTTNHQIISFNKLVKEGEFISVRKHTRFINYPKHSHDYIELNFVLSGKSSQKINNELIELKKGDLLFLGPGIDHEIFYCEKDDIIINIIINPIFFESLLTFINLECSLSNFIIETTLKKENQTALFFKNLNTNKKIKNTMNSIILEISNLHGNNSKIKLLVGLLLLELSEENPYKISKNEYEDSIILKVINFIELNIEDASLKNLALELKMKDYNLSKLIKKNTGKNFKEIVKDTRLEKICDLLINTNLPISEISRNFGFSSSSFFYKEFFKKYSKSPKDYRNTY